MAATVKIQIKRSTVTSVPPNTLDIGELAYTYLNDVLYIGNDTPLGAPIPIGGDGHYATLGGNPIFTGLPEVAGTIPAADDSNKIATTEWVRDLSLSDFLAPTGDINWNNFKITNLADPTNPQDAATKNYVDMMIQGLDTKESVRMKTTANINISSPGSTPSNFDGVTPNIGDRILVTDQIITTQNGIYVYNGAATPMTRAADADSNAEVTAGQYMFVEEGTVAGDTGWLLITNDPITLGTTALIYTQFNGVGSIIAGAGVEYTGNVLNVGTASVNRIVINANNIDLATTGVSANTYIGFAVDAYGRITSVTTPTTLTGYGITDAQPLDADLTAIAALTGTGILVRTGSNTFDTRDVIGTSNRVTVTNGNGVAGDIQVDIASTYVGQTSITTLGTISTGTWQGNTIGLAYGGTNADLSGGTINDCLIKMNAGGTAFEGTSLIDGGTF
jgi:hypothetical protein